MITLYAYKRIFPEGVGETKDLRVQWALEETGLPYRVHALDHTAGDLERDDYLRLSCFRQVPVIEDEGLVVAESAAIVLYLAEKSGKLIPSDFQGRTRVTQWCFAAVASVEPTLTCNDVLEIFDSERKAPHLHEEVRKLAQRWLGGVDRRLEGREWIATDEFTAADVILAGVLRTIRKTDLMEPFANLEAYYRRCTSRDGWQRTLELSAQRLGTSVEAIR